MYTAIQAYNIATERRNHNYYRLYKRRVKHIMRKLVYGANKGDLKYRYYPRKINYGEITVLKQIADELNEIGYSCNVNDCKNDKGNTLYFEARWER